MNKFLTFLQRRAQAVLTGTFAPQYTKKRHPMSKMSKGCDSQTNMIASGLAVLLCLSLAQCGGGDDKKEPPTMLTCIGGEILNADMTACMECPTGEFPDIDRTACVDSCPGGQIKPDNAETCVMAMVCTDGKILNPGNNTCIELSCETDEIADTTATPPECIATTACRTAADKVVNATDDACISRSACIGVANQVASATGDCEVCADTTPVRSIDRNLCIAATTCTAVQGQANVSGSCTACEDPTPLTSPDKTSCIDSATCTTGGNLVNRAGNACDQDMDSDTVTDGDDNCPNVANADQTNTDDDAMGDVCDTDDDGDTIADADDDCPTGATGMATTSDASAPTADPDMDGCKNSEDTDDDNDGVVDARDAFPQNDCASVDTDKDNAPDRVVAGCTGTSLTADTDDDADGTDDATDVDDDNDGLIEIATADELNNIRHNLAGTTYDDEEADSVTGDVGDNTGGPTAATDHCKTATDSVFLCGYELTADIDLAASDQDSGDADSNFEPITGAFTAVFDGNGHAISNLQITKTNADDASAALFDDCNGSVIRNLRLPNANLASTSDADAGIYVSFLCANAGHATVDKTRIIAVRASGRLSCTATHSNGDCAIGGLVANLSATANTGFLIVGSMVDLYASGQAGNLTVAGGLTGILADRFNSQTHISAIWRINNSYALGHIANTETSNAGGLTGNVFGGTVSINNSYTAAAISSVNGIRGAILILSGSGGLIGYYQPSSVTDVVRNSYAAGPVAADNSRAGGLIGSTQSGFVINSYARGPVYSNASGSSSGGLIGWLASATVQNSYSSAVVSSASGTSGGLIGVVNSRSSSYSGRNVYVDTDGSSRGGIGSLSGGATACAAANCVNVTEATIVDLPLDADLDATLTDANELNGWGTGNWATTDDEHPRLKYNDDPDTASINECELLPDYDHVNDANCVSGGTFCCGQELPNQRLYTAIANVAFTNATIGTPTNAAPEFFYTVSAATVTVTYNLPSTITLTASGVEQADGTASGDVSWNGDSASDGSTGQVSGIVAGETFWLALTFQEGSGPTAVTHKVRRKFVFPSP